MTYSNSTGLPGESKNLVKSRHIPRGETSKWEWHDAYLPADVVKSFASGTLNKTGLLALLAVKSLTCGEKKWCWPTNGYLANAIQVSSRDKISRTITDLVGQGFLLLKEKNGRRYLKLAWAWGLPKRVRGFTQKGKGGLPKRVRGVGAKTGASSSVARELRDSIESEVFKEEANKANKPCRPLARGDKTCSNGEPKNGRFAEGVCRQLFNKCKEENKLGTNTHADPDKVVVSWTYWERRLEKAVGRQQIEENFPWYLRHFGEPYLPDIFSGESLFKKWDKLVRAKERAAQKTTAREENNRCVIA